MDWTRRAASMGAAALLLVACGATELQPTPKPTATPKATAAATPEPTPDVIGAFVNGMRDLTTLEASLSGTIEVGAVRGTLSGELRSLDGDSYNLVLITMPGQPEEREEVMSIDGATYQLRGTSTWIEADAPVDNPLAVALSDISEFEVVETEILDGAPVHRLQHPDDSALGAEDFGIPSDGVSDFTAELAFLVSADGTPAGFSVTALWTQAAEVDVPVRMDFLYRFTKLGSAASIEPPDQTWRLHESEELGYAMARPARPNGWDVRHVEATGEFAAYDLFLSPADEEVQVYLYEVDPGILANEWMRESRALLEEGFGPVETEEEIDTGTMTARLYTLHAEDEAGPFFFQQAVVFAGDRAWDIDWYSDSGSEEDDRARFRQFVESFAVTSGLPGASASRGHRSSAG